MRILSTNLLGALAAVVISVPAVIFLTSSGVYADSYNNDSRNDSRVHLGYAAVPLGLKLNLKGLDRDLVGAGSYIVNGSGDCNGCHTSSPATEYNDPGNPFFNQHPASVNLAGYLAGGNDFGPVGPGVSGGVMGTGPHIISRNLTPDHTGLPEGGHKFSEFRNIMRTGHDYDNLHPNCSSTVTDNCYSVVPGNEIDGTLLQVMPWPTFNHMSEDDIRAIYEYLRAVPCNANSSSPYPWVRNVC
jgi:hypothetical protein